MRQKIKALALLSVISLAACANGPSGANKQAVDPKALPPSRTMTMAAFHKECPLSKDVKLQGVVASALLVAGAGALIDVGIDLIGSAIRKAGEEKSETISATPSVHFHKAIQSGDFVGNDELDCLVIVHGPIYQSAADPLWPAGNTEQLKAAKIYLAGTPTFYLEAKREFSPNRAAFRYVPTHLSYNNHIGSSWGERERDLVITAAMATPSSDSSGKAFALGMMRFPKVTPPSSMQQPLHTSATQWMPVVAADAASVAILETTTAVRQQISKAFGELRLLTTRDDYLSEYEIYLARPLTKAEIERQNLLYALDQKNKLLKQANAQSTALIASDAYKQQLVVARHSDKKEPAQMREASATFAELKKISDNNATILKNELGDETMQTKALKAKIVELTGELREVFPLADGKPQPFDATPINVLVQVTETRDENKFLLAVADALSKAAPAVKTTLKDALPESAAQKEANLVAAEGLAEAALAATQKYELALAEFGALPADATPVQRLQKEQAVALALLQANAARRKAGLPALS